MSGRAGRNTKKGRRKTTVPTLSIEELLDQKDWDEVRERLKRITSPKRVGDILYHVLANDKDIPSDILKILFNKLPEDRNTMGGSRRYEWSDDVFWETVCNVQREQISKKFREVLKFQNPDSFREIIFACVKCLGTIDCWEASCIIMELWERFIPRNPPRFTYNCDTATGRKLLNYASSPELLHSSDDRDAQELNCIWKKTVLLILATQGVEALEMGDKFPLIRTLLVEDIGLPKFIFWFAQMIRKNELVMADDIGRVPLHWAAHHSYDESYGNRIFVVRFATNSELNSLIPNSFLVEMLLRTNPETAKIRDNEGRLPLQLLLNEESRNDCTEEYTLSCVKKLIQITPEALLEADPQTKMLPFMTAAAVERCNKGALFDDDTERLELIYTILRENPSVVASGINTRKELQLMQQLDEAKLTIERLQKENDAQKKRILELLEDKKKDSKPEAKKTKTC